MTKTAKEIFNKPNLKTMQKRKRPCQVNTRKFVVPKNGGCGNWEGIEFKGLFHNWGQEAVEAGEQGFGNFTVGIVEDESGQVHTVNPNHIKFLDN